MSASKEMSEQSQMIIVNSQSEVDQSDKSSIFEMQRQANDSVFSKASAMSNETTTFVRTQPGKERLAPGSEAHMVSMVPHDQ